MEELVAEQSQHIAAYPEAAPSAGRHA